MVLNVAFGSEVLEQTWMWMQVRREEADLQIRLKTAADQTSSETVTDVLPGRLAPLNCSHSVTARYPQTHTCFVSSCRVRLVCVGFVSSTT